MKIYIEESYARKIRKGTCGKGMQLYFELRRRLAFLAGLQGNAREFREELMDKDKKLRKETKVCKRGYILVSLEEKGNDFPWNSQDKIIFFC